MALPKQYRLTRQKEFEKVYDSGKTVRNSFLFIKFLKDQSLKNSKFGIVVSAKVSKKATVRNRIRRQISEVIRTNLDRVAKNVNVVIVTNSKIVDKEFTEIEKVVLKLLKKSKILS
jgi:ribonuclease P protein component